MSDEQTGTTSASSAGFTPPVNQREVLAKYEKQAEGKTDVASVGSSSGAGGASASDSSVRDVSDSVVGAAVDAKTKPDAVAKPETAIDGAKLAGLLKSGDFEAALKMAGIDPAGVKIPASRWAEFRKHEKETKERLRASEQSVLRKDAEVRALAAEVTKKFEPFDLARKAWDSGDIESALKHAFGTDLSEFSEMAVKHKLGQDPEVVALKRWKAEQEKAAQDRAEAEAKALAEQTTAKQRQEYCTALAAELKGESVTYAAAVDAFPDFTSRVMQIQLDAYNKTGEELSAAEAAGQLIGNLKPFLEKWSKILMGDGATPNPPNSVEAAITPQDTDRTGKSSANERKFIAKKKAQPAPAVPDADLDDDERMARWKKRLVVAAREDGFLPQ